MNKTEYRALQTAKVNPYKMVGFDTSSVQEQKPKEREMNVEIRTNEAMLKRDYLSQRIYSIFYDREYKLRQKFGLADDEFPKDPFELVKRIQEGRFVLPKKEDVKDYWDCPLNHIRFRDPNLVEDKEGFTEALEELTKERTPLKDAVMIKEPAEALEMIQKWEASE